ncbi:hypothetical protein BDQ12DRAFT_733503 [Crucibulum laeve]|uniref:REJ domain-containing protein n=1 Tax=Crucibulum laeve TaxID=68775 RepID=A0A5C3M7C3_9AGAR|nr:hypothetical protein BDQ12DRAFT_733503 [Crucibulum laeve]
MSSSALPSHQQIATLSSTQIQISKPSAVPADTDSMSEVVSAPLATSKPPVKVPTSPSAAISASASSSPAPAAPPPPSAPPSTSVKVSVQATPSNTGNTRPSSQNTSKPVQTNAGGPAASTSRTAFTTTSVQLIRASTTSTSTSTITTSAESTFTSAVPITITNASNGRIVLSTPPLVTILSTSTEPDGSFLTFTHVVANPTGFNSGAAVNTSGFLQNQGAVAGVFVVVGIIAAAIATGLFFLFRRRRRLDRRRRWLAGMQQQRPPSMSGRSNPFADPHDSPVMRAVGDSNNMHWNAGGAGGVLYTDEPVAQEQTSVRGLAGVGTGRYTTRRPAPSDGPFDAPYDRGAIGLALTTNNQRDPVTRSAQSSPSIYPASLPAEDGNNAALWEQIDLNNQQPPKSTMDAPPPRPPRSHLRDTALRAFEYHPMTPPASVSSHAGSKPPSPTTEQIQSKGSPDNVFARRTLLDVRPRPPF